MKYRLKILDIFLLVLIALIALFFTFEIFGIPFGKIIAEKKIREYIYLKYPDYELSIDNIQYNSKDTEYFADIVSNNKSFTKIQYCWTSNDLYDEKYVKLLDKGFDKEIENIINKDNPCIVIVDSSIRATIDTNYRSIPDYINRKDIIHITLRNKLENYNFSKESFVNLVIVIINSLQEKYLINEIEVAYLDKDYCKKNSYILCLNKKQLDLTKEEMIRLIKNPSGDIWQ